MAVNPVQFKLDQLKAINEAQRTAIAAEEATFNSQLKKQLLRDQLSNSSSERGLRRTEKIDKIITVIRNFFSTFFGWLFRGDFPLAHYIALFIVIMVLFGAYRHGRSKSWSIPNLRIVDRTNRFVNAIKRFLKKYFGWLIPSSYRLNLMSNLFTPFGGTKLEGITRSKMEGGRCDHLLWKEESNQCQKTSQPSPIRWILDTDKMPEISDLPSKISQLFTDKGSKMVISIPYGNTGINYMPDCSKMTFLNGRSAKLLNQVDLKDELCRFVEKPSMVYNKEEKRPSKSTNVYQLCKA